MLRAITKHPHRFHRIQHPGQLLSSSLSSSSLLLQQLPQQQGERQYSIRNRMTTTTTTTYTNALKFKLSPETIQDLTEAAISKSRQIQDKVASLPENERTFESVVMPLAYDEGEFAVQESTVTFPSYVYENKEARDAASAAEQKISDFNIESTMRRDVYAALKTVQKNEWSKLQEDQKRLLSHMIRDFERNGLNLPEEQQEKIKELKQKLSKLCITFTKNLGEDTTKLLFTEEELEGCPKDFLEGLNKEDGKYVVTLKVPDVVPVMKYAKKPETRRKLDKARESQCQEQNVPLFEEALQLRNQIAEILGFDTYADYILDIRMAKNKDNVMKFLKELKDRLTEGGHKELQKLKELKRTNEYETDYDKINNWDYSYYDRLLHETEYQLDENLIKNYFPFEHTFNGLLSIVQETFGLRFQEQPTSDVWYHDVQLYNVFDAKTSEFIGQFYLDLFPREGKYNHFAAFPLCPHYYDANGTEHHPVSAMVCNFPKPTKDAPSLLKHNDVVTLFHEFGHLCHGFCSKAKYSRFSGTSVERDFVEMPSQFMENYCYEFEALKRISKHYQTGEPLSDELIHKIIAAKNAGISLFNLRQLFFGFFDMYCHTTKGKIDSGKVYAELKEEVSLIPAHPGTNRAASFGHLMGGYEASYYGYLYSQVFSADMFNQFKESGSVFNKDVGHKYRKTVLETGGMKDGIDILREFLGREPNQIAFLKSIGLIPENTK
jgi:Zn-dependent oligopeptidase